MNDVLLQAPRRFDKIRDLDAVMFNEASFKPGASVTLDLSPIISWRPVTVVGTLLIAERLRACMTSGLISQVRIDGPEHERAQLYGSMIGFPEMLVEVLSEGKSLGGASQGTPGTRIVPLTRFSTAEDVDQIANLMASAFETELMGLSFLLQPCHIIFSELADNILHHSETSVGYVAARQFELSDHLGKRRQAVEIAVGDSGIGIARALRKNPNVRPKDDIEAVRLAMQEGVSGLGDPHRGYGLWYVKQEVVQAAGRRILILRTGEACVRLYGDGKVKARCHGPFEGTLAHAIIPCPPASKYSGTRSRA